MCGIAGFVDGTSTREAASEALRAMTQTLAHRGPDDEGHWLDDQAGVGLGYRRLAIVDLSPTGRQPMVSSCKRYTLVFNGEIYNFRDLRNQLEARSRSFRGTSDTEVLAEAISEWGIHHAVVRCNGMFAFALWDQEDRALYLARDRLGKKPLYYGRFGETFLFGSELKALRAHRAFRGDIDRGALALYLRYGYVPSPRSIYRDVFKLPQGTMVRVDPRTSTSELRPQAYWSLEEAAERSLADQIDLDDATCIEATTDLLLDAVAIRNQADVPVGVFLSGGIDSSTVTALMQVHSKERVRSFSVGFENRRLDEAPAAAAVARHLGTDHTELYVTPQDALDIVPLLPALYDEPFADSSQIPTFLISRLTRRFVKVGLSGDGGDEVFAGYNRYLWPGRLSRSLASLPQPIRRAAANVLAWPRPSFWERSAGALQVLVPRSARQIGVPDKIQKLVASLRIEDEADLYRSLVSQWNGESVVRKAGNGDLSLVRQSGPAFLQDPVQRMIYLDTISYLPDDILVKVDRASMGASLEMRAPLLDYRVLEFAWRLPMKMKIRGGRGKWILRQVLDQYVPSALVDRPKAGFAVPLDEWLRGPLRDWAENLLAANRLEQDGFLEPAPIRTAWDEHLAGRRNFQARLWTVLMFQAWLESIGQKAPT